MVDYRGGLPAYEASSVGYRVEFWTKAMAIVARSPIIGHGTGSTREMYQQAAGRKGLAAAVTDNPHNQTLIIAIPLGLLGTALLFAVWIAHLRLFRPAGLAGWIGLGVVVQNMVAGLFNVSLFEFTMVAAITLRLSSASNRWRRQRKFRCSTKRCPPRAARTRT